MKRPNATWNDFCTQITQKELILGVSSFFLSYEEQTKPKLATLGQEIKNLQSELKEYHVNAVAVTSRTFHPNQQGRQISYRFCNYWHKNGLRLNWCPKKMRDEVVQKIHFDISSKRNISPIKNSSTKNFNGKSPNDHTMNSFLDLDDGNSPSNERLSNKEANRQHETEPFTPPERKLFPRNNGMSFDLT